MTEFKSLFVGEEHAALYKKYRPDMKNETVQKIIDFLAEKFTTSECDAADVGCGSGQGTLPLAPFLHRIVGLDPSEAQIKQIKAESSLPHNVEFRVGEAENLPFKDSSLQLVTVRSAIHWFDIPKFFKEVDRVLQPGGVLAVSTGSGAMAVVGHEEESKELFRSIAQEYRTPELMGRVELTRNKLRDIQFPYDDCVRHEYQIERPDVAVGGISAGLKTLSNVAKFVKEKPEEAEIALKAIEEKLMKIIGATGRPEDTTVTISHAIVLILCRKPQADV